MNSVQCKNEVVTIIKQIQEIEKRIVVPASGLNTFTFSQNSDRASFNIGASTFTATRPEYLCTVPADSDYLYASNPSSDCGETRVAYESSFNIKDSQKHPLNNLIDIQYFAGGKLTNGQFRRETDWSNSFIFTVDASKAFQIQGTYGESVLQDSDLHLNFNIVNNLPKGDVLIKVRQKIRQTNQYLTDQVITATLNH